MVVNAVTRGWLWIEVLPIPAITIVLACAVTIYTRSLWPATGLVILAIGLGIEQIAVTIGERSSPARDIALRAGLTTSFALAAELVVGALAGWLWYRRETRLMAEPADR